MFARIETGVAVAPTGRPRPDVVGRGVGIGPGDRAGRSVLFGGGAFGKQPILLAQLCGEAIAAALQCPQREPDRQQDDQAQQVPRHTGFDPDEAGAGGTGAAGLLAGAEEENVGGTTGATAELATGALDTDTEAAVVETGALELITAELTTGAAITSKLATPVTFEV